MSKISSETCGGVSMPEADSRRRALLQIFDSALRAVNGRLRVRRYLEEQPPNEAVYLIAAGKAATAMTQGALDALSDRIADAWIVTKHGHEQPLPWPVLTAGHPLPDEYSLAAGASLREFISRMAPGRSVIVLLSGGASTLLEVLPPEITLDQLRAVNSWLLASGLDIAACNQARKRISLIKGGRLAQWLAPRSVLCLVISDVCGDNLRTIASGPLTAHDTQGSSALDRVLKAGGAPDAILHALTHSPPAPEPGDPCFRAVRTEIIANLGDAMNAAGEAAAGLGYPARVDSRMIKGDAIAAGARLGRQLRHTRAGDVRVWGGETTLALPPSPGRGGRNQSLALSAARALHGCDNALFLAAGTDGADGLGEDAGALVDGGTVERARDQGIDADDALRRADAGSLLEASGDLIQTGPTGTNVMDIMLGMRY